MGGADGAVAGDRRRAGLQEDKACRGEGKTTAYARAVSVAQRTGAQWTETRWTGAGLWPQPLESVSQRLVGEPAAKSPFSLSPVGLSGENGQNGLGAWCR